MRLAPKPASFPGSVPAGRIYRDGTVIGEYDMLGIRQRKRMAFAGHIAVAVVLDERGEVIGSPRATLTGIPHRNAHTAER